MKTEDIIVGHTYSGKNIEYDEYTVTMIAREFQPDCDMGESSVYYNSLRGYGKMKMKYFAEWAKADITDESDKQKS